MVSFSGAGKYGQNGLYARGGRFHAEHKQERHGDRESRGKQKGEGEQGHRTGTRTDQGNGGHDGGRIERRGLGREMVDPGVGQGSAWTICPHGSTG